MKKKKIIIDKSTHSIPFRYKVDGKTFRNGKCVRKTFSFQKH